MASLLDIGPLTRPVTIRGITINVKGVSGLSLFHLLDRFPEMRKVFSNAGVPVNAEDLLRQAPGAVAAIAVFATSDVYEPLTEKQQVEAEARFLMLSLGEQLAIVMPIWDLTFPSGVQSFIEALAKAGLVTKSGWGLDTPSPGPSNNSSQPDTNQNVSGTTPQE